MVTTWRFFRYPTTTTTTTAAAAAAAATTTTDPAAVSQAGHCWLLILYLFYYIK
jgi:hypothetical protein